MRMHVHSLTHSLAPFVCLQVADTEQVSLPISISLDNLEEILGVNSFHSSPSLLLTVSILSSLHNVLFISFQPSPPLPPLQPPNFSHEVCERLTRPGVAVGLAWSESGGEIMYVEASKMVGSGGLVLTGQLGDVMKESAQIALNWVRANSQKVRVCEWMTSMEGRGGGGGGGGVNQGTGKCILSMTMAVSVCF